MLTQLEAVNIVLMAQGLTPASTVEGQVSKDTQIALTQLTMQTKLVQHERWDFNSDPYYTLSIDAMTGEIATPSNLVRFVVPGELWIEVRDGKLYNRKDKTTVFTSAKEGSAMFMQDWDDLPPEAQSYIAHKTARVTYESFLGSDETRENLYREEQTARTLLEQQDAESAGYTMLTDPHLPYIRGNEIINPSPRTRPY
jgi:hypothetical protein